MRRIIGVMRLQLRIYSRQTQFRCGSGSRQVVWLPANKLSRRGMKPSSRQAPASWSASVVSIALVWPRFGQPLIAIGRWSHAVPSLVLRSLLVSLGEARLASGAFEQGFFRGVSRAELLPVVEF